MSRLQRMIAGIAAVIGMMVPVALYGAPAATAAEAGQNCSFAGKWGLRTYYSGNIIFRKWYYSHGVCWTVQDQFARLSTFQVVTHRPQEGTSYSKIFGNVYHVGDTHALNQIIDIEVWKSDGSWIKVRLN